MFGELNGIKAEKPTEEHKKFVVMVIDTEKQKPQIVDTIGGCAEWYRLIGCDLIDIQSRSINGREYDFITDDEALYKQGAKVSALDKDQQPVFVGNLVICKCDDEGNETGLDKADIELLTKHICSIRAEQELKDRAQTWASVYGLEY